MNITLSILFGICGFVGFIVSITGVVPNIKGDVAYFITSQRKKIVIGVVSLIMLLISTWIGYLEMIGPYDNEELNDLTTKVGELQVAVANIKQAMDVRKQEVIKLTKGVKIISRDIDKRLEGLNAQVQISKDASYEDATNLAFRATKLIGVANGMGCDKDDGHYRERSKRFVSSKDVCETFIQQTYEVVVGVSGLYDSDAYVRELEKLGFAARVAAEESQSSVKARGLGIIYPSSVDPKILCILRNEFEMIGKSIHVEGDKPILKYAVPAQTIYEKTNGRFQPSNYAIQIAQPVDRYLVGVKEISDDDWKDVCAYSKGQTQAKKGEQDPFNKMIEEYLKDAIAKDIGKNKGASATP